MKRAKLTQLPGAIAPQARSAGGADLTDRLLDREQAPKQAEAGARPARRKTLTRPASKPAAAKTKRGRAAPPPPAGAASPSTEKRGGLELAGYVPYRTVEPGPAVAPGPALQLPAPASLPAEAPAPIKQALAATEKAVAALIAAAGDAPARYDLAVRYRLDALAHHLRQVSDFIASRPL